MHNTRNYCVKIIGTILLNELKSFAKVNRPMNEQMDILYSGEIIQLFKNDRLIKSY